MSFTFCLNSYTILTKTFKNAPEWSMITLLQAILFNTHTSYSIRRIHLSQLFHFKLFKLWNVLIWLKYDYMYHLSKCTLWDHCADTEVEFGGKYRHTRANTDIWGQIRIFIDICLEGNNQHWLLSIIEHAKTNVLQQYMW